MNSALKHVLFFFPTKFNIQTKEEELHTCFMIEIIMIIIKKTQKWESKGSPSFEKFPLTSLVSMFMRVSKWPWALFCMQNLSQISGPVCPQLFDLASFLWTIAFDKAEPTLERWTRKFYQIARFRKNCSLFEFNHKKGKITKIV